MDLKHCRTGTPDEPDLFDLQIGNRMLLVDFKTSLDGQKHEAALCSRHNNGLPFCDAAWPSSYTLKAQGSRYVVKPIKLV